MSLQTMRRPGQAARRQKHWAIPRPSPGYRVAASVKTRTAWALSEWQVRVEPGTDDVCRHRCRADACCHDLPCQHRPVTQHTSNTRWAKLLAHRRVDSPCGPSRQFLRPPSPFACSCCSVLPSMPDGVAVDFQEAAEGIRWDLQHLACPIPGRQHIGRLHSLRSEHAIPPIPTRSTVKVSLSELRPARRQSRETKTPVPPATKFSTSGLEQIKR